MLKYLSTGIVIGAGMLVCSSFSSVHKPLSSQKALPTSVLQDSTKFGKAALNYSTYCASCHGEKMDAFVDRNWKFGNKREDLFTTIKKGRPDVGMPAFEETFKDNEIFELSDYILSGIKNVSKYTSNDKPASDIFKTEELTIRLEKVAEGMEVPWGIAFLPGNELLVTNRDGSIYRVKNKTLQRVSGGPEVLNRGQGGLMDVMIDKNYAKNNLVYLTYSKFKNEGGVLLATTAIMQAKLQGDKLSEQKDIFVAKPYTRTQHHYGSRMQYGKDGYLYFSVGERGNERENPQQIKGNDLGKIHRIKTDGTIPADNPFVKTQGASPSIYSYGHRNPQGLTIHPETGKIWETEHGPRGGDEINIIEPGRNYGWPVITYGINYNGKIISNISSKPGMEQPLHYWLPSIGPSGLAFVTGDKYKGWKGNLLSGSLRFQYLNRSVLKNNKVVKEEILFRNIGRVRDVRMGPDGFIYMAVETGTIYKLVPVE